MQAIKRSDPRAVERRVYFTCVDTLALQTYLQSSDMSTFTVRLSKNGGTANAAAAGAPTQVDSTNSKGLFYVELTTGDIDTVGTHTLTITNAGGTKAMEKRVIEFRVEQAFFASAVTGTLTTSTFTTDRTETTDNFWKDCLILALSGTLIGQVKKVGGYTGSNKLFSLASGFLWTSAPSNGDLFEIIDR